MAQGSPTEPIQSVQWDLLSNNADGLSIRGSTVRARLGPPFSLLLQEPALYL